MIIFYILLIFIVLHLILYCVFPSYPKVKEHDHFDMILILGCPCQENGRLSLPQQKRIAAAIYYCEHGYSNTILVSGGCVKNEFNEAEAMANELRLRLKNTSILLEKEAKNTYQNLKYCNALYPDKHILIISSPSHLRRAYFFAKKFYDSISLGCIHQSDPWYYYLWEYTRCWVALYWEIRLYIRKA